MDSVAWQHYLEVTTPVPVMGKINAPKTHEITECSVVAVTAILVLKPWWNIQAKIKVDPFSISVTSFCRSINLHLIPLTICHHPRTIWQNAAHNKLQMSLSLKWSKSYYTMATEARDGHSERLLVCAIYLSEWTVKEQLLALAWNLLMHKLAEILCSGIIEAMEMPTEMWRADL